MSYEHAADIQTIVNFTQNANPNTTTIDNATGKHNMNANTNTGERTTNGAEGDCRNSSLEERTNKGASMPMTQTATMGPVSNTSEAVHFTNSPTITPDALASNPKKPRSRVLVPPMTKEEYTHYLSLTQANLEALRRQQIELIARQTRTYSSSATKKGHIERILAWQSSEKAAARASARAARRQSDKLHKALFQAFDEIIRPEMSEEEARVYEESLVQQNSPKLKLLKATGRKSKEPTSSIVTGLERSVSKGERTEGQEVGEKAVEGLEEVVTGVEMVGVEEVEQMKVDYEEN